MQDGTIGVRKWPNVASKRLLNNLKASGFPGRITFFSDEKTFVADPVYNAQNNRYINFYNSDNEKTMVPTAMAAMDLLAAI